MKWVNPHNYPPTQNSKHLKIKVLAPFWNPILVSNCAELNSLSLPNEMSQPTQWPTYAKLKKRKIQVLAPFWDSIAAKLKNSDKMTSIVKVPSVFDNQKLSFAHAKKLFVLKFISVVCIKLNYSIISIKYYWMVISVYIFEMS